MKKIFSTALVASAIALVPTAALADPELPNAGAHQHYILTPNGDRVAVGPNLCANPNLQNGFNQFHFNVHRSAVGHDPVDVDTLGPQGGAPGLHDDLGAEIIPGPCL